MTALAVAIQLWQTRTGVGTPHRVLIDVERHGREDIVPGLDISTAVGWFTSLHPLAIALGPITQHDIGTSSAALGAAIAQTRAALRRAPDNGIGYGILRYLDEVGRQRLSSQRQPDILVNYLGRFTTEEQSWTLAPEVAGIQTIGDPELLQTHALRIVIALLDSVSGPYLRTTWAFRSDRLTRSDVMYLRDVWFSALAAFPRTVALPTPGRLLEEKAALVGLTRRDLDVLQAGSAEA
jgi:non-ribosomal peptide synthase protein (TIGR01720 family)